MGFGVQAIAGALDRKEKLGQGFSPRFVWLCMAQIARSFPACHSVWGSDTLHIADEAAGVVCVAVYCVLSEYLIYLFFWCIFGRLMNCLNYRATTVKSLPVDDRSQYQ